MKVSIMQPYYAPYMGYFQMINSVDKFVIYDDVNYIKNGWINRNKMNLNGQIHTFTIPIKNQSSFVKINETLIDWNSKKIEKVYKTFTQEYSKKNKDLLYQLLSILDLRLETISELNINTIKFFCNYLGIETQILKSSELKYEKSKDKVDNIVKICEILNSNYYINPIGGMELYDKNTFKNKGVNLFFINGQPSLSIIDVCMNNSKDLIVENLNKYNLI